MFDVGGGGGGGGVPCRPCLLVPCTGRAGPWPAGCGPARPVGRAGPGLDDIFAGRAGCGPESCRPGPGPGQSITFMRAAGRAWA